MRDKFIADLKVKDVYLSELSNRLLNLLEDVKKTLEKTYPAKVKPEFQGFQVTFRVDPAPERLPKFPPSYSISGGASISDGKLPSENFKYWTEHLRLLGGLWAGPENFALLTELFQTAEEAIVNTANAFIETCDAIQNHEYFKKLDEALSKFHCRFFVHYSDYNLKKYEGFLKPIPFFVRISYLNDFGPRNYEEREKVEDLVRREFYDHLPPTKVISFNPANFSLPNTLPDEVYRIIEYVFEAAETGDIDLLTELL